MMLKGVWKLMQKNYLDYEVVIMKKNILAIMLLLIVTCLFGCNRIINNEIYNKSYNVNIDLKEFEDLVVAAIEKASPAVIGVKRCGI